ncbi:MAG: tRNA-guanine transglycosylase, partial [Halobacteria archaeon]|nr:tRNA-guanine transglycosylase [Halobacteria archaeon]
VVAAKKGLGSDAPVHLFGAGHPMVFALAALVGCDLFDSAAYALYAKDGRYLTPRGTKHVGELHELPCGCEICANHSPGELRDEFDLLAKHNLDVSLAEMRRVRQAIAEGNLYELVEQRCRSHPRLLDGLERLKRHVETLEKYDPASKGTFFYLGTAKRPEVLRHHERLDRIDVDGDEILLTTVNERAKRDDALLVEPPFGPFPRELTNVYPLNAETPETPDDDAIESALKGVSRLAELHPDTEFVFEHTGWEHPLLETLESQGVEIRDLSGDTRTDMENS